MILKVVMDKYTCEFCASLDRSPYGRIPPHPECTSPLGCRCTVEGNPQCRCEANLMPEPEFRKMVDMQFTVDASLRKLNIR